MHRATKTILFGFVTSSVVFAIACGTSGNSERSAESSDKVVWDAAADAWVVEPNGCGPGWVYDYISNSCHMAANNGVDAGNNGIYSCTGASSGPYGHTINWAVPADGTVCLSEPQIPGSVACCWSDPAAVVGGATPSFSSPAAQACDKKLCGNQYSDGGAVALDAGYTWPVAYLDCSGNNPGNVAACNACCDTNANQIPSYWGDAAISDRENYRTACKAACAGGLPTPASPAPPGSTGDGGVVYQPGAPPPPAPMP